jgi:hypothetical protein
VLLLLLLLCRLVTGEGSLSVVLPFLFDVLEDEDREEENETDEDDVEEQEDDEADENEEDLDRERDSLNERRLLELDRLFLFAEDNKELLFVSLTDKYSSSLLLFSCTSFGAISFLATFLALVVVVVRPPLPKLNGNDDIESFHTSPI